jgi:hypothetical protein
MAEHRCGDRCQRVIGNVDDARLDADDLGERRDVAARRERAGGDVEDLAMRRRRCCGGEHERAEIVDVAVRTDDQPAVGEQDRPTLQESQEHRRLHVIDVVVRPVDRRRAHDDGWESSGCVAAQQCCLGHRLEPAVRHRPIGVRRHVLGPREHADQRLVVGHDRADVHVGRGVAVEQIEQPVDVAATGGHHESGDIEHGVPLRRPERGAHRLDVCAVGDEMLHAGRQLRRRAASVEDRHIVAGFNQRGDQSFADEHRSAEDQRLHADGSRLTSILPTLAPDITPNSASTACSNPS